jgi:hypothetical protein
VSSIDKRPPPAGGPPRQQRAYVLWQKYGMTVQEFDNQYDEQRGLCAICFEKMARVNIDHDHVSGLRRKLLCTRCNAGLGMFRDSIRLLSRAIVYLEDYGKTYVD